MLHDRQNQKHRYQTLEMFVQTVSIRKKDGKLPIEIEMNKYKRTQTVVGKSVG